MRWMDAIRRDVGEMGTLMDRIKSRFHATNFPYGCYCDVYDTLIKVQREGRGSGKGEGEEEWEGEEWEGEGEGEGEEEWECEREREGQVLQNMPGNHEKE